MEFCSPKSGSLLAPTKLRLVVDQYHSETSELTYDRGETAGLDEEWLTMGQESTSAPFEEALSLAGR
jgi:hypothetical protein